MKTHSYIVETFSRFATTAYQQITGPAFTLFEATVLGSWSLCILSLTGVSLPGPLDLPAPARLVPVMLGVWLLLSMAGPQRTPSQKVGTLWVGLLVIVLSAIQIGATYLYLDQPMTFAKLWEFPENDAEFIRVSTSVTLFASPVIWLAGHGCLATFRKIAR